MDKGQVTIDIHNECLHAIETADISALIESAYLNAKHSFEHTRDDLLQYDIGLLVKT